MDPFNFGPVSRDFMYKASQLAHKTGVTKWVPMFWDAVNKGKTVEAGNYYRTILTVIRNQSGKAIAAEMEAMLPEMGAALAEIGVDVAAAEAVAAEVTAGAASGAAALNPVTIAVVVAAILFFAVIIAHCEEAPPPPRQMPPQYRGNAELDPAAKLQLELMVQRMGRNMRPGKAGH